MALRRLLFRGAVPLRRRRVPGREGWRCLSDDHAPSRGPPYTTDFKAACCSHQPAQPIPVYRVMDTHGHIIDPKHDAKLSEDVLLDIYKKMVTVCDIDEQLFKAHKMGLISFYMVAHGEEATHFGSAAALQPTDMVYAQYREVGVLIWRGFSINQIMDQCFGTRLDTAKGRQMPVHYGSREHNYQFISSCLSTQMPQAPGYAYGLKLSGSKDCVIVYFGDGAAQEGDAHAAMNFAATLGCPVIFFCRNNGYAISTPVEDQYAGDGIASRGQGYGMESIRVDGNDVLAVYSATKYAREVAVSQQRPVLIEAMTLRLGSHSSSDDQKLYQDMGEVERWKIGNLPVSRLRAHLELQGLWDKEKEVELKEKVKKEILDAMQRARRELKPHPDHLFTDVYDNLPPRLERQRKAMWEVVNKHQKGYPLKQYES